MQEHIHTYQTMKERYLFYLENLKEKRFVTGMYVLDQCIRGVAPGEVMTIIAYSGTFKTAYLQNILNRGAKRSGLYHVMFSLEMPVEKLFERQIQYVGGVAGYAVEENYSSQAEAYDRVAKNLGCDRLLVVDQSKIGLPRMEDYINLIETKYGEVGALGVDYLGLMEAQGKTIFDKTAELTIGVKQLAKALNKPIILLCQVNRAYAASKGLEIEMDSGKGGGDIEAGCDFLLGFYLTGEGELICKLLKNRNGPANAYFKVDIDRPSLTFKDMSRWEPPKKERRIKE